MTKFDVIVCGSLHLDIVVNAPALPRIDETAVGTAWQKICGGKGCNQAVQAQRAGASTAMIGRVGHDEFGATLCANLSAAGVDTSAIAKDAKLGSGMSVAILQDDGDYGAVIVSGSNLAIDPASLEEQWHKLGGAKVLILQNEVPHAVNVAAAKAARAGGAQVVFNAAPVRDVGEDLYNLVDVLIVNRIEAEAMFGAPVQNRASARSILEANINQTQSVIITLGGDGLVVATPAGEIADIAPVPVKVTSTHGAGDSFVGVLSAELAKGQTVLAASETANQTAAAFVSRAI